MHLIWLRHFASDDYKLLALVKSTPSLFQYKMSLEEVSISNTG